MRKHRKNRLAKRASTISESSDTEEDIKIDILNQLNDVVKKDKKRQARIKLGLDSSGSSRNTDPDVSPGEEAFHSADERKSSEKSPVSLLTALAS